MTSSVETSSVAERHTGRVKWFNSKTGYGFVTVTDGSKSGTDVFVHHSSVQVGKEQYRYLVQGEYVQFRLTKMVDGPHEYQASDVTGVNCGQLMCESLLESGRQVRAYRPRPHHESREEEPRRTEAPRTEQPRRTEAPRTEQPRRTEETRRPAPTSEPRSVSGGGRGRGRGRGGTAYSGRGSSSGRGFN
jgi:CspA family cold shock protein